MKRTSLQWRLLAGVLALAVLGLGVRATVRGEGEKPDTKKDTAKKDTPKTEDTKKDTAKKPKADDRRKDIDDLLERLGPGIDDKIMKEVRERMAEARKEMEKAMRQMQQQGGLPVIPPMPMMPGGAWGMMNRLGTMQETRLGAQLRKPSTTLTDQLDLPKGQGQVLEEVGANSAAAKAGLKQHDILLELAGKPVPSSTEEFTSMLKGVKPNTPVDAVVMRKGKKETIKGLSLPEAKAVAQGPPLFPGLQGQLPRAVDLPGIGAFAGLGGNTSISRVNDDFTVKHSLDDVKFTVTGKIDQGKAKVSEVKIEANGQSKTYDSVDKVPAEHKETVQKLVRMGEKGGVRLQLR
jgi:hypothetical protein